MILLYLDEDTLHHGLVRGLRAQGFDVLTTGEAGRLTTPDEDQLAFAASIGRVIYTANSKDYDPLHRLWMKQGKHHAGMVLLSRQRTPIGAQIRALALLANEFTPESMQDHVEYLTRWLQRL